MKTNDYEVMVGDGCVTLRKRGESRHRVGTILGREVRERVELVYVDRLLVQAGDVTLNEEWSASGCISTILSRALPAPRPEPAREAVA